METLTEECREQRGLPVIETLVRDVRHAARALRREPGFTVLTVLMLGVGLGSATTMFSVVNGVLLNPLRFRQPQQLVVVHEIVPAVQHLYPALPVKRLPLPRVEARLSVVRRHGADVLRRCEPDRCW